MISLSVVFSICEGVSGNEVMSTSQMLFRGIIPKGKKEILVYKKETFLFKRS